MFLPYYLLDFTISEDTFHPLFEIEDLDNLSTTYFIDLRLIDDTNKEIDTNFYWLSTKEETLDYEADLGEFAYHTPSKIYADFTLLNTLNKVDIAVDYNFTKIEDEQQMTVTLKNTGDAIAFLINLKLEDKNNREPILPIFWEDNFISLLPGEQRTLHATFKYNTEVELKVEAWNSNKITYGEISN